MIARNGMDIILGIEMKTLYYMWRQVDKTEPNSGSIEICRPPIEAYAPQEWIK